MVVAGACAISNWMKKFTIFLVIIFFGFGVFYYQQTSICRNPQAYDIGGFDGRFGISKDKFLKTIKEAETIWEKETGQDLFRHQSGAKFQINLVFDERQAGIIEAGQSKEEIEGSRAQYDSFVTDYKILAVDYERNLGDYNTRTAAFEVRLSVYNNRIALINDRGGAAPQEYHELEGERKELEVEKVILDRARVILNGQASELNSLGDKINSIAKQLNIEVDIHNQRFGEAREFDQGEYQGNRINIYQFDTVSDLRLVMAHEFGHALDLDHVENPKSIMHYLMDKQDLNSPALSREDIAAFKKRCEFRIPRLQEIFNLSQLSRYILRFQY